jgi:hypothetical protein
MMHFLRSVLAEQIHDHRNSSDIVTQEKISELIIFKPPIRRQPLVTFPGYEKRRLSRNPQGCPRRKIHADSLRGEEAHYGARFDFPILELELGILWTCPVVLRINGLTPVTHPYRITPVDFIVAFLIGIEVLPNDKELRFKPEPASWNIRSILDFNVNGVLTEAHLLYEKMWDLLAYLHVELP